MEGIGRMIARTRSIELKKYEEIVELSDLPENEVRPVLDALLRYLGVYICRDSTQDYTRYELRRGRPRKPRQKEVNTRASGT